MAKDDMELVMYKILRYLYGCMKKGKRPSMEDISSECQLFSLPYSYWVAIMNELIRKEYIIGFMTQETKDGTVIMMTNNPGITFEGRQFLEENSRMHAAKEAAGKAFEIVLESVIKAALPI